MHAYTLREPLGVIGQIIPWYVSLTHMLQEALLSSFSMADSGKHAVLQTLLPGRGVCVGREPERKEANMNIGNCAGTFHC